MEFLKMFFKRLKNDINSLAFRFWGCFLFDLFIFNWMRKKIYGRITHGKFKRLGHHVTIKSEHLGYHGKITFGKGIIANNNVTIDLTGDICIGNHVILSDDVTIYTHSHTYDNAEENGWKHPVCPTSLIIEDGVWIGAKSTILPSVSKLGRGCIIGAGSVVTKDVDEYTVVAGNPAKPLKKYK